MSSDRRTAILDAAAALVREQGVAAVRTRDVTTRAGVGIGLLNHYFRWSALRAEAAARALDAEIDALFASGASPPDQLEAFLARAFTADADALWRLWIEATDLALTDDDMARAMSDCAQRLVSRVETMLALGAKAGDWTCADPHGAAMRILAFHDGLVGFVLTGLPELSRADAAAHLRHFARFELGPAADPGSNQPRT